MGASVRNGLLKLVMRMNEDLGLRLLAMRFFMNF